MELILFLMIISLLLVHEMDAIRAKEWKMFVVLKDMTDETAYRVFAIAHLPLFFVAFYVMFCGGVATYTLKIIIDIFLLAHALIHFCFRNHKNNGFQSFFSKSIIYSMAVLACLHLCCLRFIW
jgi:hypothetical protein